VKKLLLLSLFLLLTERYGGNAYGVLQVGSVAITGINPGVIYRIRLRRKKERIANPDNMGAGDCRFPVTEPRSDGVLELRSSDIKCYPTLSF
jgi:hypothetical protein